MAVICNVVSLVILSVALMRARNVFGVSVWHSIRLGFGVKLPR